MSIFIWVVNVVTFLDYRRIKGGKLQEFLLCHLNLVVKVNIIPSNCSKYIVKRNNGLLFTNTVRVD